MISDRLRKYCRLCFLNKKHCPPNSLEHTRELERMRRLEPEYRARKAANQRKCRLNPEYHEREKIYFRDYNRKRSERSPQYQKRKEQREEREQRKIKEARKKFIREEIRFFNKYWQSQPEYLEKQRENNRERAREYARIHQAKMIERQKYRHRTDPAYRLRRNLRSGLFHALKRKKNRIPTMDIVGCTAQYLLKHLSSTLPKGFTMQDFLDGKLHIDHIMPLNAFDQSDMNQVRIAWNWQNLQLLPAKQNRLKHAKIVKAQLPLPITLDAPNKGSL
jgi:hypothetical protein